MGRGRALETARKKQLRAFTTTGSIETVATAEVQRRYEQSDTGKLETATRRIAELERESDSRKQELLRLEAENRANWQRAETAEAERDTLIALLREDAKAFERIDDMCYEFNSDGTGYIGKEARAALERITAALAKEGE